MSVVLLVVGDVRQMLSRWMCLVVGHAFALLRGLCVASGLLGAEVILV